MIYGSTIGRKFFEDGSVRRYPGNTVVADITPECPAYDVMLRLNRMVSEHGLSDHYIMLPADSYHMTVIRGLNDQVRTDDFWPASLPKDASMDEVDDYVSTAIAKAKIPGQVRMRFFEVKASKGCMIAFLVPADEEQNRLLRDFRDRAADALGLRLPKHDEYRFHISLGYTRVVPEGEDEERRAKMIEEMNALIANQPDFLVTAPYMAYYDDMYAFSPKRIPRD